AEASLDHVGQAHHAAEAVGIELDMGNECYPRFVFQAPQEAVRPPEERGPMTIDAGFGALAGHRSTSSIERMDPSEAALLALNKTICTRLRVAKLPCTCKGINLCDSSNSIIGRCEPRLASSSVIKFGTSYTAYVNVKNSHPMEPILLKILGGHFSANTV